MRTYIVAVRESFGNTKAAKLLRKFDHWLRLHYPRFWIVRLPYLVAYIITAHLLTLGIVWALRLRLYHINDLYLFLWVYWLLTVAGLYFWNQKIRSYTPDQTIENTTAYKDLVDLLVYFGCVLILITPNLTAMFSMVDRFDNIISREELQEDLERHANRFYPIDLIVKYSGIDPIQKRSERAHNYLQITKGVFTNLDDIKSREYKGMKAFSFLYLIVIYAGLLMYTGKHVRIGINRKEVVYLGIPGVDPVGINMFPYVRRVHYNTPVSRGWDDS